MAWVELTKQLVVMRRKAKKIAIWLMNVRTFTTLFVSSRTELVCCVRMYGTEGNGAGVGGMAGCLGARKGLVGALLHSPSLRNLFLDSCCIRIDDHWNQGRS